MLKYAALSGTNAQTTAAGCCAVPTVTLRKQNPWQGPKSSCTALFLKHIFFSLSLMLPHPPTCVNLKDSGEHLLVP